MDDYILEIKNIIKKFSGVRALNNVNLNVKRGEIHALVGENGAGKSTLMNILSGVYPYGSYEGDVIYNGSVCRFKNLNNSEEKGIVIIHQEFALIPELSIGENIFLGNERLGILGINWNRTKDEASTVLRKVGLNESPNTLVKDIGTGKQQLVEIAKALSKNVSLLILDEPTSALNDGESKKLLDLLLELKNEGKTCIIISHKLKEIAYVADRITVIRDGATIGTVDNSQHDIDEDYIIKLMVGRELINRYPKRERTVGDKLAFEVDSWNVNHPIYTDKKVIDNVSFNIKEGEIVGFYGLQGAGRTELAMSIFGHSYGYKITGKARIMGRECRLSTVRKAIESGLAYVTEDRKNNGLLLANNITVNTTLAMLDKVSRRVVLDSAKEESVAEMFINKLSTKATSTKQIVSSLSGGNQQKVLLSKWMYAEPKVLILDEPTRGIDVGAKYEIFCIMNELIAEGKSIMMISSELPDLLGMCDRIYIMNDGKIVDEMPACEASGEKIIASIIRSQQEIN